MRYNKGQSGDIRTVDMCIIYVLALSVSGKPPRRLVSLSLSCLIVTISSWPEAQRQGRAYRTRERLLVGNPSQFPAARTASCATPGDHLSLAVDGHFAACKRHGGRRASVLVLSCP
jgi:hypothetical protein